MEQPITESSSFYKSVLAQITDITQTNLIIGHLTLVLDPYLDRSSSYRAPPSNSSIFFTTLFIAFP